MSQLSEYLSYLDQPQPCVVCGSQNKHEWARDDGFVAVQCGSCGLIWIDPPLNEAGQHKYNKHDTQSQATDPIQLKQRQRMIELENHFLEQFIEDDNRLDI